MNTNPPMTIGQIEDILKRKPEDVTVMFDFAYFSPSGCHSYRGDFSQPAIGYSNDYTLESNVKYVLSLLHRLQTESFYGYKGGEYNFNRDQTLYVARHDESPGTVITDIYEDSIYLRFETTTRV